MRIRVPLSGAGPSRARRAPGGTARTGDDALTRLYTEHYRPLVRLAALLVQDAAIAEEITQAAFVAMNVARPRLPEGGVAVTYLRRAVVRGARAALRRRAALTRARGGHRRRAIPLAAATDGTPPGHEFAREPVVVMLRSLPDRQREALVLRYYGGLSDAQAAAAMGVSKAALRRHAVHGAAALRTSRLNE